MIERTAVKIYSLRRLGADGTLRWARSAIADRPCDPPSSCDATGVTLVATPEDGVVLLSGKPPVGLTGVTGLRPDQRLILEFDRDGAVTSAAQFQVATRCAT